VPTARLTDIGLLKFKPSDSHIDYWDATLPTFGVRVSPKGTKTFILKIHNGRQAIGRYPILSLAEARTEAKRILAERTLGKVRPQSITYAQAVKLFIEDKKRSRRSSTAEQYEWFLGRLTFGQLGDIRPDDLSQQLSKIKAKSTYDHVLVAARIFFNWCLKRQYIGQNPTFGLSPHGTKKRSRILSDQEFQSIWRACHERLTHEVAEGGDPTIQLPAHYATIVKLLILTGQRRGEIAALKREYFSHNQQIICLPPSLTKNGLEHTFPLSTIAIQLLKTAASETSSDTFLFPARGKKSKPFNGWSKSKVALDKLSGVTGWTLHDLRRTFRSNLGRHGVAPHIAERYVNHISAQSDMEQTYDRWKYLPELRDAAQRHDRFIASLLGL
jgi:integrase